MTLGRGPEVADVMAGASTATGRSHGRIQLQVLDYLYRSVEVARVLGTPADFVTIVEIAGHGASRSRVESMRRAAKSLADEGLVQLSYPYSPRSRSPRDGSTVNLILDVTARLAQPSERR
jgi:hypothetical protein